MPILECDLESLSRIIEHDRIGTERMWIETPAHPLQHRLVLRVTRGPDHLQELCVAVRAAHVFWGTSARPTDTARIRTAVVGHDAASSDAACSTEGAVSEP